MGRRHEGDVPFPSLDTSTSYEKGTSPLLLELRALREERARVLLEHLADPGFGVAAPAHLVGGAERRERIAVTPVRRRVHADALVAEALDDVDAARRRALAHGIQREPRPEAAREDLADGVLLGVVDQHALGRE